MVSGFDVGKAAMQTFYFPILTLVLLSLHVLVRVEAFSRMSYLTFNKSFCLGYMNKFYQMILFV